MYVCQSQYFTSRSVFFSVIGFVVAAQLHTDHNMLSAVAFRRATQADRGPVLAINDNIYEGWDYLPDYYDYFEECPNCFHFVAEYSGSVVSRSVMSPITGCCFFLSHYILFQVIGCSKHQSVTKPCHLEPGTLQATK